MNCTRNTLAIVGVGCRLPGGVRSVDDLWALLLDGRDAVTHLPEDRFDLHRFTHPDRRAPGRACTSAAGIIDNLFDFDPDFFGISRKEAEAMDPQQRLVLEMTWEAFEDAGIRPSSVAGSRTAVFMGAASTDAGICRADDPCVMHPYSMTGTSLGIISNRVSYIFDLHGPSMTIDTACSSSMVALHQACRAVLDDGLPMAIAGGVNVLMSPLPYIGFSKAHMLSEDGRCKVFDASGNGYVRAEGGGVLLIKPLQDALDAGDRIHALIRATGVNSDGRTTGIALPNLKAQQDLLQDLYAASGVDPNRLVYVEAHGTGTAAGDPIEATAIGTVLGCARPADNPLPVGSVKSNIGHLETGSGMAGLIKALAVLRHGIVPANLHLQTLNPAIDAQALNILIPTSSLPVADTGAAPLVGVNSFGFGGTNAHVILEGVGRSGEVSSRETEAGLPPLFLSARSPQSLRHLAREYAGLLGGDPNVSAYDLAASAFYQREFMDNRLVITAGTRQELCDGLNGFAEDKDAGPGCVLHHGEAVCTQGERIFVFSGNGCQWQGMGARLLGRNAAFDSTLEAVDALLTPLQGWSILEKMHTPDTDWGLDRTEVAQPMLFALQVALAAAFADRGIVPDAVYGHSVGEVSAACVCGALSLEDACRVIYHRSRLQEQTHGFGGMAAVNITPERAEELIAATAGKVELAAVNAVSSVTLAGNVECLRRIGDVIAAEKGFFKMLPMAYPFHCASMDGLQEPLLDVLRDIRPVSSRIRFISTVEGREVDGTTLDASYWWRNIRCAVQFAPATRSLLDSGARAFLEIGSHGVLQFYVKDAIRAAGVRAFVRPTLQRQADDADMFEQSWRKAVVAGWTPDGGAFFPRPYTRMALPAYPWNHEYLHMSSTPECAGFMTAGRVHPLLGWRLAESAHVYENVLDTQAFPWLAGHTIGEASLFPAAAFIEVCHAVARRWDPDAQTIEIVNLDLRRPLVLSPAPAKKLRTTVSAAGEVTLTSRTLLTGDDWLMHGKCRIRSSNRVPSGIWSLDTDRLTPLPVQDVYSSARELGYQYDHPFMPIVRAWRDDDAVVAEFALTHPEAGEDMLLAPPLVDGAQQLLFLLLADQYARYRKAPYLPSWFGRMIFHRGGDIRFARARLDFASVRSVVASFELYDADGHLLAEFEDCRYRNMDWRMGAAQQGPGTYRTEFVPAPHPAQTTSSWVPGPSELASKVTVVMESLAERHDRSMYFDTVLPLCQAATIALAHEVALPLAHVGRFSVEDGIRLGYARKEFVPYLTFILELLASQNLAVNTDGTWEIRAESGLPPSVDLWRTIIADYPAHLPEAILVGRVGLHLRDLVAGRLSPELLLGDQVGTVEHFYANAPSVRLINDAVTALVRELVDRCPQGRRLRILEVGAAPGGLLGSVVTALDERFCEYVVSDKNAKALEHLEAVWGDKKVLSFAVLDMEHPETHEAEGYDLILAGQALHAADSVDRALAGCLSLLAPHGLLVCLERGPSDLQDMIQGVDPWWWSRSASPAEPASRLQAPGMWERALQKAGYADVRVLHETINGYAPDSFLVLGVRPADGAEEAVFPAPVVDSVFVLLTDEAGGGAWGDVLCPWLEHPGVSIIRLAPGCDVPGDAPEERPFDPEDAEHWRDLFHSLAGSGRIDCVHLCGLDQQTDLSCSELDRVALRRVHAALAMAQGWEAAGRPATRFWLVTGGCQEVDGESHVPVMSQAALWGFGRVLQNEMPGLDTRLVDIFGPSNDMTGVIGLVREILAPGSEREIVLSGSRRYRSLVEAFDPCPARPSAPDVPDAIRLMFDAPGRLERLYWRQVTRRLPERGEVQIQTMATGLNFRDVMWAMGMLPDEALENGFSGPTMGIECSGVVSAVGLGVQNFQVGDEVVCFAPNCFSSFVITTETAVALKPAGLSHEEAATVPVAFFTAYYAIKHLAGAVPGERILIHGAAGGVGLAAIQIANHLGLEVFATAGSDEKRDFLHLLGVDHILDSRSLQFADDVLRITDGQGVDMVLNSLHGPAIERGLSTLRSFGRFLELGKRDFYGDTPMYLRPFRNNITYFGIDVDQLLTARPQLARTLFAEMMDLFDRRILRPLPHRIFARANAADAFRIMQQSRHIGKLVVSFDDHVHQVRPARMVKPQLQVSSEFSYLITGGLGGFGLKAAQRLIDRGARHLLLLGRSGMQREEAKRAVEEFRRHGVQVAVLEADVGQTAALESALESVRHSMPPLRGVIHAAGVLDDAVIANQSADRMERSWRAKASGAWNLHQLTRGLDLDFFVLFSSATTLLGNPGQANYVAANCALEALAAYRRHLGLPGLAVGWGAISDVGMLARNGRALESLKNILGVVPMTSAAALDMMEQLHWQNVSAPAVFQIDWRKMRHLATASSGRFAHVRGQGGHEEGTSESMIEKLRGASRAEGIKLLIRCIAEETAAIMRIPIGRIDPVMPVAELGMDSLMAVELGIALEERLGAEAPSISLSGEASIATLAERFLDSLVGSERDSGQSSLEKTMQLQHATSLSADVASRVREKLLAEEDGNA